jgi:hypothetical protein
MEYTKGNWNIRHYTDSENRLCTIQIGTQPIPPIYPAVANIPLTEYAEANANLISAAPDMYEALKLILKRVETEGSMFQNAFKSIGQEGLINAFIMEAKRAIAKAEGR